MSFRLNAADTAVFVLIIFAAVLFSVGLSQSHTGYLALGFVELGLAIAQFIVNRKEKIL